MADDSGSDGDLGGGVDTHSFDALNVSMSSAAQRTRDLASGANSFARAMATAFTQSVSGAKQFDDVLKSLALRLSNLALAQAFKPVASGLLGGVDSLFSSLTGNSAGANLAYAMGGIKPFASGGVVGTPTYFPLAAGGLGLAGEAGPEAILPLARGADGRLGVAAGGGGGANISINIATPDADSFRRSEAYLTGQIARAVARGQRSL